MNHENITYEDKYYYLAFSYFQKIGPVNMKRLEKFFPDMHQAWFANAWELERAGLNPSLADAFINWRKSSAASIANIISELKKEEISFITWKDPDYPALLKEIAVPPPVLYYKGEIESSAKRRLAVVGSRKFSAYGSKAIAELLPGVIESEIEIISGLALGIDALAHQKTLELGGKTWAVLGSGLDFKNIYPAANRRLAENIINHGGALISEFPPGTPPHKQNFPQRNRIIAGLAQATLIVEAPIKSGALITADWALEENREVLAVPGNIFAEFSAGPNKLIKSGARPITATADILEVYGLNDDSDRNNKIKKRLAGRPLFFPKNENEAIIYKILKETSERAEKISSDEIIRKTNLDTAVVNSTLSILEIQGIAKNSEYGYDLN
ncbi:MAG: DNA-processing protein DprA [Candidatus Falkowbacteria bacterium]|nr:DNA-processing protein DprA [Candidatus Falkowbacteria bacterium]